MNGRLVTAQQLHPEPRHHLIGFAIRCLNGLRRLQQPQSHIISLLRTDDCLPHDTQRPLQRGCHGLYCRQLINQRLQCLQPRVWRDRPACSQRHSVGRSNPQRSAAANTTITHQRQHFGRPGAANDSRLPAQRAQIHYLKLSLR